MTTWRSVARKEIRGLIGNRTAKIGIGLVMLVFVLGGYIVPTNVSDPTIADYDEFLRGIVSFLVPLFGLLLGYRAVVGERATGRLTLMLSFPYSRADVVVGKVVGRGIILVGTIAIGILGGAWLVAYPFGTVALDTLASYVGATALFGVVFLAIGVGLSTLTSSLRRATVFTFGTFFLSAVAWPQLDGYFLQALEYLNLASDELPDWAVFVHGVEPGLLYIRVLNTFVTPNQLQSGAALGSSGPWYMGGSVAVVLLFGWALTPIVGGYLQFQGTDL